MFKELRAKPENEDELHTSDHKHGISEIKKNTSFKQPGLDCI